MKGGVEITDLSSQYTAFIVSLSAPKSKMAFLAHEVNININTSQ